MILSFTNTFRDLWLFNGVHQWRSPVAQAFYVLMVYVLTRAAVPGTACEQQGNCAVFAAVFFCVIYTLAWGAQWIFNAVFLISRGNRFLFCEHQLELRDEGLYVETPYRKCLFLWHGIHKVVVAAGMVSIYIAGQAAILVPSRAFASRAEQDGFVAALSARISR